MHAEMQTQDLTNRTTTDTSTKLPAQWSAEGLNPSSLTGLQDPDVCATSSLKSLKP